MKRSIHAAFVSWWVGVALALTGGSVGAQLPDPADPGSATVTLDAVSVLPDGVGNYLERVDQPGLPWAKLYEPDGSFVPESAFGGTGASASAAESAAPATAAAPRAGDSRGVVRKVDMARSRVTIKHGPIEKLDMPGMTMVFRARDPALLDGLEPGEEVEFDVTVEGTTFFITGIRK